MLIVTASEMRECDRRTIQDHGVPGARLMERAGLGCARAIRLRFPRLNRRRIWIFCGKGNNGGDGLVLARALHDEGLNPRVLLVGKAQEVSGDAGLQIPPLRARGLPLESIGEAVLSGLRVLDPEDLLVDAILGTGFRGDLSPEIAGLITAMNESPARIVAIDLPSGLTADRGEVSSVAVQASLTVTMAYPKRSFFLPTAREHVGEWTVVDIGIPPEVEAAVGPRARWVMPGDIRQRVLPFARDAHKGSRGKVLIAGGSPGLTGAPCLAALGAGRSGAGLVRVAVPRGVHPVLETKLTEALTIALPETDAGTIGRGAREFFLRLQEDWDALVLGPGLGRHPETDRWVHEIVGSWPAPLVVDADGLNALAATGIPSWDPLRPPPVLTPHAGEMARLAGLSIRQVLSDPMETARAFAVRHAVVVVLKGTPTVVSDPTGNLLVSSTGNPGLATGGSGDVLAGMIGTLLAQRVAPWWAGACAAYLHGLSADRLRDRVGERAMLPSEVAENLREAWSETLRIPGAGEGRG